MDYEYFILILLLLITNAYQISSQHEDIPYEDVGNICERCVCETKQDANQKLHHVLGCSTKSFKHILASWPPEFGRNHAGTEITVTFSGNQIPLLQQLPATKGTLFFSCRHCSIKEIQAPTFMDVPNIKRLDISWNEITGDILTPEVFRGPYNNTLYEPIGLQDLDFSHNSITELDGNLFEHTPRLLRLNLASNKLRDLNSATISAIVSASQLEHLDLSYNGLTTLPERLFKALISMKSLHIQGNNLKAIPAEISLVGRSLETLNVAENQIVTLNEKSFLGLKVLKLLNISAISSLEKIEPDTFSRLETLEHLLCTSNLNLTRFDLEGLMHSSNLTSLDISNGGIETISFKIVPTKPEHNSTATIWPKLRKFHIAGNPWNCNCDLFKTLEQFDESLFSTEEDTARCESPLPLASARIFNMTSDFICNSKNRKFRTSDDPPRFLRPKSLVLTIITIAAVIAVGTIIGFGIVIIRKKMKRDDFGVAPIRYTTVRSSTASVR